MHLVRLDQGLLKISGPDSLKLLQGQLTCDVTKLEAHKSMLTAHLNPQGRVISLAHIFKFDDDYYLLMPNNLVPIATSALKKYALFYRVNLIDASNTWTLVGSECSDHHTISIAPKYNRFIKLLDKDTEINSTLNWKLSDINDGIPAIYPETSGVFLPHEINLPALGAISFDKGCYTGQEIVARMHYRGKLKKGMSAARISTKAKIKPGDLISNEQNHTCGMVVDVCRETDTFYRTLIMIDETKVLNQQIFIVDESNKPVCFELEIKE